MRCKLMYCEFFICAWLVRTSLAGSISTLQTGLAEPLTVAQSRAILTATYVLLTELVVLTYQRSWANRTSAALQAYSKLQPKSVKALNRPAPSNKAASHDKTMPFKWTAAKETAVHNGSTADGFKCIIRMFWRRCLGCKLRLYTGAWTRLFDITTIASRTKAISLQQKSQRAKQRYCKGCRRQYEWKFSYSNVVRFINYCLQKLNRRVLKLSYNEHSSSGGNWHKY